MPCFAWISGAVAGCGLTGGGVTLSTGVRVGDDRKLETEVKQLFLVPLTHQPFLHDITIIIIEWTIPTNTDEKFYNLLIFHYTIHQVRIESYLCHAGRTLSSILHCT